MNNKLKKDSPVSWKALYSFIYLFLQPFHKFIQTLQSIDIAIADFVVLADVIAAFDKIVLSGAFRFGGEHTDFIVMVAD